MKFNIATASLILIFTIQLKAQSDAKLLVSNLQKVFQQKSTTVIEPQLAKNFSIGAYTDKLAINMLQNLTKMYQYDSIAFVKQTANVTSNKIDIIIYQSEKKTISTAIYTNQNQQILYIDLFDQLYGMNRYQTSKLVAKIPFEVVNGAIILTVTLNQSSRPLKLLFDTGADGMAISETLGDSLGLKISRKQNASVVGGNMQISIAEDNDVHLGSFVLKNQSIALFKEMHKGNDGIIGNSMTKLYITKVDFDKKELSLFDFGDYQYEKEGKSIPVTTPEGLFIIPGIVSVKAEDAHQANLVFDTGADYSLICFRPFVKKYKLLVNGFKSTYHGSTTSLGMTTPTYSGQAASFSFASMPPLYKMNITLMAGGGQSESWNPGFDGSIGIKLISRYNFTINMQRQEIHLTPNQTHNYPFDFYLGGYLFGFNAKGELSIQSVLSPGDEHALNVGTVIHTVNDLSAQALLKDPKKIDLIQNLATGAKVKITYTNDGKKQIVTLIKS